MAIVFTQDWDVIPGMEDEYEEFIGQEYMTKCEGLGLRSVGGFYVEVGFGPRIVFLNSTETLEELYKIMASRAFKDLTLLLKKYVINYRSKILEPTGHVKHAKYELQKGVWKFNQYYDLIPGKKEEYADFVLNEHIPSMSKLDYVHVTGGWNVLIGGFSEIIAEFTFKDVHDIARLLDNPDFRNLTFKLTSNYAVNHMTRIMRCTERFDEPKWYRL